MTFRAVLLTATLAALVHVGAAAVAHADDACSADCDNSYPCRNDGSGCFGRVTIHKAGHATCSAKCSALDYGRQKLDAAKKAADAVVDYGKEKLDEGKKAVEAVVDYGKQKLDEGKKAVGAAVDYGKQKLKDASDYGKKKLDDAKKKVGALANSAKDALCGTSVGKVACAIIRDASSCYWGIQKGLSAAPKSVKDAVNALRRFSGGIAGVTRQILSSFGSLKSTVQSAVGKCRDWLSRSKDKVVAAVKEAVCKTSAGKPVCAIIADAAQCYGKVREGLRTAKDATWKIKNAIGVLSPWQGGISKVSAQLVRGFGALKSSITGAIKVCKEWAGRTIAKGVDAIKARVLKLLDGLTCEKIVEAASSVDPVTILLSKVPAIQTCRTELQKGFICKIPNLVKDIVTMLKGALKGAWENKLLCGSVGLATAFAGIIPCGLTMWMGPKLAKAASCLNSLRKSQGIVSALKAIFAPGEPDPTKPKWWGMMKFGCNFIGGILTDVVIAALTGGGSIAGSISGQIVKMLPALAGKTSQWILQKAVGAGIAGTQQLIRVVDRSLPAACR